MFEKSTSSEKTDPDVFHSRLARHRQGVSGPCMNCWRLFLGGA